MPRSADARRRLEEAGGDPAEGERGELEVALERLERRREALGGVNPFAKEEYAARKSTSRSWTGTQTADLEQSLTELDKLRRELAETVERRFSETFAAVEANFAEVASTLFPGGEGRLRLTEPKEKTRSLASRSSFGRRASASAASRCSQAERRHSDALVPLRAVPRAAVPLLPPRRGGGGTRRCEHRSLRRPTCGVFPSGRSSSSLPTRSGRWRRPTRVRRDDGERCGLPGCVATAAEGGRRGSFRCLRLLHREEADLAGSATRPTRPRRGGSRSHRRRGPCPG